MTVVMDWGEYEGLDAAYGEEGHLMREKMEVVEGLVWRGGRLLDVGCGTGEALGRLAERFEVAVGVEISGAGIEWARGKVGEGVELVRADGRALPVREGWVFDCCLMLDVLEHLEDPERALREAARVMSDGGQLVVTVPNWMNWITARLLRGNPRHRTFHTAWGWAGLLGRAGFLVQQVQAVRGTVLVGMCLVLVGLKWPGD